MQAHKHHSLRSFVFVRILTRDSRDESVRVRGGDNRVRYHVHILISDFRCGIVTQTNSNTDYRIWRD